MPQDPAVRGEWWIGPCSAATLALRRHRRGFCADDNAAVIELTTWDEVDIATFVRVLPRAMETPSLLYLPGRFTIVTCRGQVYVLLTVSSAASRHRIMRRLLSVSCFTEWAEITQRRGQRTLPR